MPTDENSIHVIFKTDFKSPTLDVAHAEYRRTFKAIDQPFAVTEQEFKRHLNRLGVFAICPERAPAAVFQSLSSESAPEAEFEQISAESAPDDTIEKE